MKVAIKSCTRKKGHGDSFQQYWETNKMLWKYKSRTQCEAQQCFLDVELEAPACKQMFKLWCSVHEDPQETG